MLYHLLYPLRTVFGWFNVFRYITFRSIFAILTALIISLVVGAWFIRKLREMQIGQGTGHNTITLLRIRMIPIVCPEACFHVSDRDMVIEGSQCADKSRCRVPLHKNQVRVLPTKNLIQSF